MSARVFPLPASHRGIGKNVSQMTAAAQRQLHIVPLCGTMCCMKRAPENRSLDRGLTILQSLSEHGASSLGDLHDHTGLAKSTIRRLLGTLVRRKVVRRSLADQLYRANIALPMPGAPATSRSEGWLVDCAVPHMIELTRSVGWVCDLHIFERTHSRIIESTRPLSPFFQHNRPIGLQVTSLGSAAGLAVLSTWTHTAVLALIDEIGDDPVWGLRRVGLTRSQIVNFLEQVRATGFSSRPRRYLGGTAMANTLSAIACAIFHGETAVGALVMLWPKGLLSPAGFAQLHLEKLRRATAAITVDLTATG